MANVDEVKDVICKMDEGTVIDWKRKLTSRKFWAAVALFVSGLMTALGKGSDAEVVAGLIMQGAAVIAYIIGEGLADASYSDFTYIDNGDVE